MKLLLFAACGLAAASPRPAAAQQPADPYAHRLTLLAGLGQPLIGHGVNVAGTYYTRRLTFEYSHGMHLTYRGAFSSDADIKSIYARYSTGLGVGYRLTERLDVRAEAKLHEFTAQLSSAQAVTYINADLGLGAYYRLYPYAHRTGWARGLVVEPSVRYWHHVHSTLPGGGVAYQKDDGTSAKHQPYDFGLFPNVSVGYTFGMATGK